MFKWNIAECIHGIAWYISKLYTIHGQLNIGGYATACMGVWPAGIYRVLSSGGGRLPPPKVPTVMEITNHIMNHFKIILEKMYQ